MYHVESKERSGQFLTVPKATEEIEVSVETVDKLEVVCYMRNDGHHFAIKTEHPIPLDILTDMKHALERFVDNQWEKHKQVSA